MNTSDRLIINGNKLLSGDVKISGAKNSALPLMTISLLIKKGFQLKNVPSLIDTTIMKSMINELGIKSITKDKIINFDGEIKTVEAPENLVNKMRASILILAPLLSAKKKAVVPLPGGCAIGARPIDLHIKVIKKLGAKVELKNNFLRAYLPYNSFIGNTINFPKVSVGATECAILASVISKGKTILRNVANEPEIIDLVNCLNKAGAKIRGIGKSEIAIDGVEKLHPTSYTVVSDRIEAGSFALAAAITRGNINIKNVKTEDLKFFLNLLKKTNTEVNIFNDEINVKGTNNILPVNVSTQPYPGFPTDLQAQFMSLMCISKGCSIIEENIFEDRFQHVPELKKMGANIKIVGKKSFVKGIKSLKSSKVISTDLRASMSLILAGLSAHGKTKVYNLHHLRRGYEDIENKLSNLGADIS